MTRQLDRVTDPCPKLGGLVSAENTGAHVVRDEPREHRGSLKARCVYCSRTIDLGPTPAVVARTAFITDPRVVRHDAIVLHVAGAPETCGQADCPVCLGELAQGQLELELAEPRSCASCGGSLEGLRPQATTCSNRCRQALARSRRPAPVRELELRSCRYCHRQLPAGSKASTCSTRCRSAMHRQRTSALDTTLATRLSPVDLFRLQAAHGPDAPEPMRVAGSSFWACRCGLVVRETSTSCGFCGGLRPSRTLLEVLA